jgi:hypothetical protein
LFYCGELSAIGVSLCVPDKADDAGAGDAVFLRNFGQANAIQAVGDDCFVVNVERLAT